MEKGDYVFMVSIHKTDRTFGLCEEINKIFENKIAMKVLEIYEDTNSAIAMDERTNNPFTFVRDDLVLMDTVIKSEKPEQMFHYNTDSLMV